MLSMPPIVVLKWNPLHFWGRVWKPRGVLRGAVYYVGRITARRVVPVRMGESERAEAAAAAAAAEMSFSEWVRRACVRQAELERSLDGLAAVEEPERPVVAERVFTPDFGARLKR